MGSELKTTFAVITLTLALAMPTQAHATQPPSFQAECLRDAYEYAASPNPYEALLYLKKGVPVRFQLKGRPESERFTFERFQKTRDMLSFRQSDGSRLDMQVEDFLAQVVDGSLQFEAGKGVSLNTPIRYFSKFETMLKHIAGKEIEVSWKLRQNPFVGLANRKPSSFKSTSSALFAPSPILNQSTLYIGEWATLGTVLRELRVARRWNKLTAGNRDLWHESNLARLFLLDAKLPEEQMKLIEKAAKSMRDFYARDLYDAYRSGDTETWKSAQTHFNQFYSEYRRLIKKAKPDQEALEHLGKADLAFLDLAAQLENGNPSDSRTFTINLKDSPTPPHLKGTLEQKKIADDFQRVRSENFKKVHDLYLEAKIQDDPHVKFLEEVGHEFYPEVKVPSSEEVMAKIAGKIDALLEKGLASKSEVLRPARVYLNRRGALFFLRPGEPVPRGLNRVGVLSETQYIQALAAGFFPVGYSENRVQADHLTFLDHDLAHFSSYVQNPRYMAAVRRAAQNILKDGNQVEAVSNGKRSATQIRNRFMVLTEHLTLAKPEAYETVKAIAGLPNKSPAKVYTVQDVSDHLAKMNDPQILGLVAQLEAVYPKLVLRLGGTSRDILNRSDPTALSNTGLGSMIDGPWREVLSRTQLVKKYPVLAFSERNSLAQVIVGLMESSRVDPVQAVEQGSLVKPPRDSPLYRWLCLSGVLAQSDYKAAFCD